MTQNTFLYYVGLIYSRDRNKSIHVRVLPAMFQMIFGSGKTPHVNEYITVTRINQTLTLKRILCHGHGRRGLIFPPFFSLDMLIVGESLAQEGAI